MSATVMHSSISPTVAAVRLPEAAYPTQAPFHPSEEYPEYPFRGNLSSQSNHVYKGVRELFRNLGYDKEHWNSSEWNPLGSIVKPGMTVVIKPNFVLSRHKEGKDLFAIITHPSVLRAVADYCWIALRGTGRLLIADAPQYDCNFSELEEKASLRTLKEFYISHHGPTFDVLDLRTYWSRGKHFPSMVIPLPGDPLGNMLIDIGERSTLRDGVRTDKLYGAVYHRQELISQHTNGRHAYQVSRTIMSADVVISVPKLKVHKKVGVTLNAKGLVGITTNKNHLVHYTLTSPSKGGDQYPDGYLAPMEERLLKLERWMYDFFLAKRSKPLEYVHRSIYALHRIFLKPFGITIPVEKRLLDAGNWYGNDSAWRMVVDLFNIFHFADREGTLKATPQRKTFSVIDGVIGGENKGPLVPDPKPAGVLLAGENFLAVDLVSLRLMGFDWRKLRTYWHLLNDSSFSYGFNQPDDIRVESNVPEWRNCFASRDAFLRFIPYPGWVGHVEIESENIEYSHQGG